MKIHLLIDIDEDAHGDALTYPVVADILRRHANRIEDTEGNSHGKRYHYGAHSLVEMLEPTTLGGSGPVSA